LNLRIDQLAVNDWDIRIFHWDATWGWNWSTHFVHALGGAIYDMVAAPTGALAVPPHRRQGYGYQAPLQDSNADQPMADGWQENNGSNGSGWQENNDSNGNGWRDYTDEGSTKRAAEDAEEPAAEEPPAKAPRLASPAREVKADTEGDIAMDTSTGAAEELKKAAVEEEAVDLTG
jgi:hypothetical protein